LEEGGRRKEEGGRRKEEGGRRKEERGERTPRNTITRVRASGEMPSLRETCEDLEL
jgi:hypothetical protein